MQRCESNIKTIRVDSVRISDKAVVNIGGASYFGVRGDISPRAPRSGVKYKQIEWAVMTSGISANDE